MIIVALNARRSLPPFSAYENTMLEK